jgi:hypothetical protein
MSPSRLRLDVAFATLTLCTIIAGCESISGRSDADPSIDFSKYRTYSWVSPSPLIGKPPEVSPLAEVRVESAVTNELNRKGYRFVEGAQQADFVVAFTIGARDKLNVTSTPFAGGWGPGPMWGGPYYGDINVRQSIEGRLSIDLFDTKLRRPVWTGYATKSITSSDERNLGELANKAVAAIFEDLPSADGTP